MVHTKDWQLLAATSAVLAHGLWLLFGYVPHGLNGQRLHCTARNWIAVKALYTLSSIIRKQHYLLSPREGNLKLNSNP